MLVKMRSVGDRQEHNRKGGNLSSAATNVGIVDQEDPETVEALV